MKKKISIHINVRTATNAVSGKAVFDYYAKKHSTIVINLSNCYKIRAVLINGIQSYFTKRDTGSIEVVVPDTQLPFFYSAIPSLTKKEKQHFRVIVYYEFNQNAPSLIHFPGIFGVTNRPFSLLGWMPKIISYKCIEKIQISVDDPSYSVIGPVEPKLKSEGNYVFDVRDVKNRLLLCWAATNMQKTDLYGFRFFHGSIFSNILFSFLKSIEFKGITFLLIPHSCDLEITNGFAYLSTSLLSDFIDFPSIIPIPPVYHLISAVSFAVSFFEHTNNTYFSYSSTYLHQIVTSHFSLKYMVDAIGDGYFSYLWALLRYANEYATDCQSLVVYNWNLRDPNRVKGLFILNILSNQIDLSIPKSISEFKDKIGPEVLRYLKEGSFINMNFTIEILRTSFNRTWLKLISEFTGKYPPIEIVLRYETMHYDGMVPLDSRIHLNESDFPTVFQSELLVNGKNTKINKLFDDDKKKSISGLLYVVCNTLHDMLPIIICYKEDVHYLLNMLTYPLDLNVKHDALISLVDPLLHEDSSEDLILDTFSQLLGNNTFFTIRCHILQILGDLAQEHEKPRQKLIDFFFSNIADQSTGTFRDLSILPQPVIVSAFRAIASIRNLNEKQTTLYFYHEAVSLLPPSSLSAEILLCFLKIEYTTINHADLIIPFLIKQLGGDGPMAVSSAKVLMRFMSSIHDEKLMGVFTPFISMMHDRQKSRELRLALCELLFVLFREDVFVEYVDIICEEIDSWSPNIWLIERLCEMISSFDKDDFNETKILGESHAGFALKVRKILLWSVESHDRVFEQIVSSFNQLKIATHKISEQNLVWEPLDYSAPLENGLFSDDELN